MKSIDFFIFDFDGTLVDSGQDLADAVNYTLSVLGLPVKEPKLIKSFVGDGVHALLERSLGGRNMDKFPEAFKTFSEYYGHHLCDRTELYPDVSIVLDHFRHKRKIILTNKLYNYTVTIAKRLAIESFFEEIIGADSTGYKKPEAQILEPVLKKYEAERGKTVIVGDGVNDIMLAKNTEILSCAFLNGLTAKETLLKLKPDFVCHELKELTTLFN